jgi:hypothetical protein
MKKLLPIALLCIALICPFANAAASFRDSLLPAVKNGGFAMSDYCLWCSSVIRVGDTFQMFASRWPGKYGLNGWTDYSECVRATSKNLFGPYTFQEVVLQKRPGMWDSRRVHNVKIVKAGSKYVLYYISTSNATGYATADSVTGPWTRIDHAAMDFSNPAPIVMPDQSVYVFGRKKSGDGPDIALAYTAKTYDAPYTLLGDGSNLLPDGDELEDPTIWWANNQYNVLVTDIGARATGISKAGTEYFSKDGLHYQRQGTQVVFTKTVDYDDGTQETFSRRERPFVYVNDKQQVIALFTACLPKNGPSRIVVQPVLHYTPGN